VPVEIYVAGPRTAAALCGAVRSAIEDVSVDFRRQFGIDFEDSGCFPAP